MSGNIDIGYGAVLKLEGLTLERQSEQPTRSMIHPSRYEESLH